MKKKWMSLLLVLALCLGLTLPASAAEGQKVVVGDETYEMLLGAIMSETESDSVTARLDTDVTLTAAVVLGSSDYNGLFPEPMTVTAKNVTIDLNGNTLTAAAGCPVFEVQAGYTLTIVDNSAAKTGKLVSDVEAVVVAEGATYNPLPAAQEDPDAYPVEDGVASVTTMAQLKAASADDAVEKITITGSLQITEDMQIDKSLTIIDGSVVMSIAPGVKLVCTAPQGQFCYEDIGHESPENFTRLSAAGVQFLLTMDESGTYREMCGSLTDAVATLNTRDWMMVSLTGDVTLTQDLNVFNMLVFGDLTLAEGVSLTGSAMYVYGDVILNGQEAPENLDCEGTMGEAVVNPFTDVAETSAYYEGIMWAVQKGITTGRTETTFVPGENCTEANILTFLWRAEGSPASTVTENPFGEAVSETAYYYGAALWAYELGMIDETFAPNTACTRAQAVRFMWIDAGSPTDAAASSFTDAAADASYAAAVNWAVDRGITKGTGDGTTFSPATVCTRGQIVTFLYRAANYQASTVVGEAETIPAA